MIVRNDHHTSGLITDLYQHYVFIMLDGTREQWLKCRRYATLSFWSWFLILIISQSWFTSSSLAGPIGHGRSFAVSCKQNLLCLPTPIRPLSSLFSCPPQVAGPPFFTPMRCFVAFDVSSAEYISLNPDRARVGSTVDMEVHLGYLRAVSSPCLLRGVVTEGFTLHSRSLGDGGDSIPLR